MPSVVAMSPMPTVMLSHASCTGMLLTQCAHPREACQPLILHHALMPFLYSWLRAAQHIGGCLWQKVNPCFTVPQHSNQRNGPEPSIEYAPSVGDARRVVFLKDQLLDFSRIAVAPEIRRCHEHTLIVLSRQDLKAAIVNKSQA